MLDIQNLNYIGGIKRNDSSNLKYGVGKQGGSKAWEETYDKIMNSKESLSFYLVAAQGHLDEITANDFALRTGFENGIRINQILKTIQPLSKENNEIYGKILNTLGVQSIENIIDKAKTFGKKTWSVIKEAFRKLRLVFTNIIQAIRKAFASYFNGGDTKDILSKWNDIINKANKSTKTIKVPCFSPKRWLKIDDVKNFADAIKMSGARMNTIAENVSSKLESGNNTKFDGAQVLRDLNGVANVITKNAQITNGYGTGAESTRKTQNIVKLALYGVPKPVSHDLSIKNILNHKSAKYIIDNETVKNVKNISDEMDKSIKAINKILNAIEKIEKSVSVGKDDKTGKNNKVWMLKTINAVKQNMINFSITGKEMFISFVQLRKTVIRAAKVALGESDEKK